MVWVGSPKSSGFERLAAHASMRIMARVHCRFSWMLAFFAAIFIAAKLPVFTLFAASEGLLASADCLASAGRSLDNTEAPAPAAKHHGNACACANHAAGLPNAEIGVAKVIPEAWHPASPLAQPVPAIAFALASATGPPAPLA
jgi:hypothetical protein